MKRICKKITDWNWVEIQELYNNGKSTTEITKIVGISFSALARGSNDGLFITRARTETMKLRGSTGKGRVLSNATKERISQGMKLAVIEGRQKTLKPYGRSAIEYKGIQLQSKWELKVAEFLDSKSIIWERPTTGHEYQFEGQSHLYFPDFYLPQYNLLNSEMVHRVGFEPTINELCLPL